MASVPFAFLAGLLRSRLSRASAVSDLVARLGEAGRRQSLREALAEALGDPSLSLAYWLPGRAATSTPRATRSSCRPATTDRAARRSSATAGRSRRSCHDAAARHRARADPDGRRRRQPGARERAPERRAARSDRGAARVASPDRPGRRRRAPAPGARPPRRRPAAAGLAGAQSAAGGRQKLDSDPAAAKELLEETASELGEATTELRELARGLHPAVLSDRGLRPALEALAGRAPVPVELRAAGRAAAGGGRVGLLLRRRRGAHQRRPLRQGLAGRDQRQSQQRDDRGRGPRRRGRRRRSGDGLGLRGLADRVAALDGGSRSSAPPGGGTMVRAVIPCA